MNRVRIDTRPLLTALIATWAMLGAAEATAAECKGMPQAQCEGAPDCSWVNSYTTKTGTTVKAYCRTKSKKGSASTAAKKESGTGTSKTTSGTGSKGTAESKKEPEEKGDSAKKSSKVKDDSKQKSKSTGDSKKKSKDSKTSG